MNALIATSLPISNGEVAILFWATIGGVFVFFGLMLEKFSEWMNDRFLAGLYKPHRTLELIGWCILMFGIFVEIGVAGWSANDAWQTRQMAIKSDPFNQPVSDISAYLEFEVNRTYSSDLQGKDIRKVFGRGIAGMFLCGTNKPTASFAVTLADTNRPNSVFNVNIADSAFSPLIAESYERLADTWGKGKGQAPFVEFTYLLNFALPNRQKVMANHLEVPIYNALETYNNVRYLLIIVDFLPYAAEVREGTVDLVINGEIHKRFYILSSKRAPLTSPNLVTNLDTLIFATDSPSNSFIPNVTWPNGVPMH